MNYQDQVRDYYAAQGEREWERITRPEGGIEFIVTTDALARRLPSTGRVLDVGGGPGRYTIWLAQQGYQVVLLDLSPDMLAIARVHIHEAAVDAQMESVVLGDACNLHEFSPASFDAVLCLGPFYHLAAADRERAASEVARVLRPRGLVFAAFMPIYTFLRRTLLLPEEQHRLADPDFVSRLMDEGAFRTHVPGRFDAAFGVRPPDVAPFMERHGFTTVELLADTGFATSLAGALADLAVSNPAAHEAALRLILQTAADPSLLGGSIHLLYVGRKH